MSIERINKKIKSLKSEDLFGWLDDADAEILAQLLRLESASTIAAVLAHAPTQLGAELLRRLPEGLRAQSSWQLAQIQSIAAEELWLLSDHLRDRCQELSQRKSTGIQGDKKVIAMLTKLSTPERQRYLDNLKAQDPGLGKRIEEGMFVFEDLRKLIDVHMQCLLAAIDRPVLLLALRQASARLIEKITSNLSRDAGRDLIGELATTRPQAAAEVQKAQQQILALAHDLAVQGKISLNPDELVA